MIRKKIWMVVTYDVNVEDRGGRRRLRRVAKLCERHGQRVQHSVFEVQIDMLTFETFRIRLIDEIDEKRDSLRFYRLGPDREKNVWEYGVGEVVDFDDPLIV